MFEVLVGTVWADHIDALSYIVVGLLAIFTVSLIIKKVFKLALIFTLITIMAYYMVPDLFASFVLP
ncbi:MULTISPECIES: hypothetical protein [Desulfitobacterium]|uniref:Uncharacterized protein n=1 Tax=Desulfitobacterium dehalogenans (strain ATCC 51507 / DSM 9161 / JW/IU-DC1) TaxID=756499 RepID=I4ACF2_DESDJ|nr:MULTISPECIES: hypothetical protein [Desulfitobacterium]AFM01637.1 hypothetical protein Desde_3349 [Desulfitobacterium dehalogenans ATCC 51507]